jgi:hypothetical protein
VIFSLKHGSLDFFMRRIVFVFASAIEARWHNLLPNRLPFSCRERAAWNDVQKGTISRVTRSAATACSPAPSG